MREYLQELSNHPNEKVSRIESDFYIHVIEFILPLLNDPDPEVVNAATELYCKFTGRPREEVEVCWANAAEIRDEVMKIWNEA